jgi:uncharacterized protein YdhG (YjbR/CyaY superfamily)
VTTPSSVEEYLAGLPDDRRGPMDELRATIRAAAPQAAEGIAYDMPAWRLNGRFLVSIAAYKRHYSLFPGSERVLAEHPEAQRYFAGKGTLQFPATEPLPLDLVTKVVATRLDEVADRPRR